MSPYQVDVILGSVACAVSMIGGWMFDRTMAGWHLNVFAPDGFDIRPLQILGVRSVNTHADVLAASSGHPSGVVAIESDLFQVEDRRLDILNLINEGYAEVVVYGDLSLGNLISRVDRVGHRLSDAAVAFKAQALRAAAATSPHCCAEKQEFLHYLPRDVAAAQPQAADTNPCRQEHLP
jgi:hypothetical protein